jgi:hypothetical protein
MVGSNRQSKSTDDSNNRRNKNGSAFEWVPKIANTLGYTFDPALMADYIGTPSKW